VTLISFASLSIVLRQTGEGDQCHGACEGEFGAIRTAFRAVR
jgi:hypothetical protein